jgi:hypothetical protein
MRVYIGPYVRHWNAHSFQHWYLYKKYKQYYWEIDEENYDRLDRIIDKVSDKWQDVLDATINKFNKSRVRKIKVRIDPDDTWGMDHTLALIILPMLKQIKETKHGSPLVDSEDVPIHIRPTEEAGPKNGYTDDTVHQRWEWVLDEMIWAFEQLADENSEDQFYDEANKFDRENFDAWNKRIQNGLVIFGKYFRSLWD